MSDAEDNKKQDLSLDLERKHLYWLGVLALVTVATWIRYVPAQSMKYLQALDPFMIARMSAAIVKNGYLPAFDALRFFPYPTPTQALNLGNIYIPAYLYMLVKPLGMSFMSWAKTYPALIGGLTVLPVYLMTAEVFDRRTGLFSGLFLASSVAILHRSSAGWFEKEPIALLLMIFSMYFFLRAWRRESWISGILSGISLGIASISWGGTYFLVLFYPVAVGSLIIGLPVIMFLFSLLFDIDIKPLENMSGLFSAYFPTVILGTLIPFILNFISFKKVGFIANLMVLLFLAVRYGAEKYEVVEESWLPNVSLYMVGIGMVFLLFSPLIAPPVANTVDAVINKVSQSGGGVIGGTVAENAPARTNQIISKLGASQSAAVIPGARYFAEYLSGWTFGIIGLSVLGVLILLEFLRHYFNVKYVDYSSVLGGVVVSVSLVSLAMYLGFSGSGSAFVPAVAITGIGGGALYAAEYLRSDSYEQWQVVSMIIWFLLFIVSAWLNAFAWMTILGIAGGVMIITSMNLGEEFKVKENWLYIVFFLWMASTVYGATKKSRLIFLAAAPVATCAGIGASKCLEALMNSSVWDRLEENLVDVEQSIEPKKFFIIVIIGILALVNLSAAYSMSKGSIRGAPNGKWMENLEYMREETPRGSVILSWWDYGYWFETIGERPAVADGGNMGYYTGASGQKINHPLADFLTSSNTSSYRDWLSNYSVDYIVLDSTMIGKYSAVSQIAHGSNENFNYMRSIGCVRDGNRCRVGEINNNTVVIYRFSRNADVIVPIESEGGEATISGAPIIRMGNGRTVAVGNICTPDGLEDVHEKEGTKGGLNKAMRDAIRTDAPFGGCVALHPRRGVSRAILIPPVVMESNLVKLYVMDGSEIDFVDKVFDNGFVKMWKVEDR
ncbi:MAG: STT3 domain-containing protein [Candidatus Nanohaloarchaea archaeon]|nr:STT3 domain-containing protein [Candidatus Nanohaloarchaea archaeon]